MVLISIVTSTYGREEDIKKLISSCKESMKDISYEIIVVSSDPIDSEKINWLRKQKEIRLICMNDRMAGKKRERSLYYYENLGCRASKGEWLLVLNDDMELNSEIVTEFLDKKETFDIGLIPSHIGEASMGVRIPIIGEYITNDSEVSEINLMDVSVMKSAIYWSLGGFDENLDWFGKGLDLPLRLLKHPEIKVSKLENYISHSLTKIDRNPPHFSRDFAYLNNKFKIKSEMKKGSLKIYDFPKISNKYAAKLSTVIYRIYKILNSKS